MLLRSNPFEVFDRLERELFEPLGGTGFGRLPMNVVRSGDAVEVTFDLPGIDPDSIDVTVEGNLVTSPASAPSTGPRTARSWSRAGPAAGSSAG